MHSTGKTQLSSPVVSQPRFDPLPCAHVDGRRHLWLALVAIELQCLRVMRGDGMHSAFAGLYISLVRLHRGSRRSSLLSRPCFLIAVRSLVRPRRLPARNSWPALSEELCLPPPPLCRSFDFFRRLSSYTGASCLHMGRKHFGLRRFHLLSEHPTSMLGRTPPLHTCRQTTGHSFGVM